MINPISADPAIDNRNLLEKKANSKNLANYKEINVKKSDKSAVYKAETKESIDYQISQRDDQYKNYALKAKEMKAELESRMMDTLFNTTKDSIQKQTNGVRGFIASKMVFNEDGSVEISGEFSFKFSAEEIEKATNDLGEDGYWGVEKTSQRLLEFAKALSHDDPSKGDLLLDAVKRGFEVAEEFFGGELPEISQKTYDRTMELFDEWMNGKPEPPIETKADDAQLVAESEL